ncbi:MAG: hypothetical protein ABFD92_16820 [Planctomycetaceae bacterium]|nr:hypothetical protein [Planctomycetaceae bacterium]
MVPIGLIASARQWRDGGRTIGYPHTHVAEGLRAAGYEPLVVCDGRLPLWDRNVSAAVLWNGGHGRWGEYARTLRRQGCPVLVMEHGWFDRRRHVQMDWDGFNARASWAPDLMSGVWEQIRPRLSSAERFETAFGRYAHPVCHRNSGYVLVLLQVPGDYQLQGEIITTPGPLVRAVEAACPKGIEIRVRAHPLHDWQCGTQGRSRMIGGTLEQAVAGARFCVTVNSSSANEAMAWGCPVLALGAAVYTVCGLVPQVDPSDLPWAMEKYIDGGLARGELSVEYLHRLAHRQWSFDEIARGDVLGEMMEGLSKHAPL